MHSSTVHDGTDHLPAEIDDDEQALARCIDHAAHLLPAQGPITVFIHHNTLHAFEDLPFNEAVKKGAEIFGCQPYLSEEAYRQELARGRIRFSELREALEQDLGEAAAEQIPCFGTRLDLRLAMLQYPSQSGSTDELKWHVAEANSLRRVRGEVSAVERARLIAETRRWVVRDLRAFSEASRGSVSRGPAVPGSLADLLARFGEGRMEYWTNADWEGFTVQALWRLCCDGVRDLPPYTPPPNEPIRHRDLLYLATGIDADLFVGKLLIKFTSAFLDQGMAVWPIPDRDLGFFKCFARLYRRRYGPLDRWMRGLDEELGRLDDRNVSAMTLIKDSLRILGVPREEWERYISETLLALRGWAGMIHQVETRADKVVQPIPKGTLQEFLAVRLLLDRYALAYSARIALGDEGPLDGLREVCRRQLRTAWPPSVEQRAFHVFQLAQVKGLTPDQLYQLSQPEWRIMVQEVEAFTAYERRRVFHLAFERRFYNQSADAIALHNRKTPQSIEKPRFQAVFCLDDREESMRRHIEELAPDAATYGIAGFFSVPIYYRGVDDAHFKPLCPAIIRPRHWVTEHVVEDLEQARRQRSKARRALGMATHRFQRGSRSLTAGAVLAGAVGVLATIPLVARILFPRFTSRINQRLGTFVKSPPLTRLTLERSAQTADEQTERPGFTIEEMTDIGERVLRDIGLTRNFSRLVFFAGHGSTTMNNPHESAQDCGACGGSRGGPNARAIAQILNHPQVRTNLAARGLVIPADTYFLGGFHNTTTESLEFHDEDLLPETHEKEYESIRVILDLACARNAHERCRRFQSAPLSLSFAAARQHVEGRAEDLAQVRPEWGHATNALCFVGRRDRTRGLFLDRRVFLTSYDPTQDDAESSILTRILQAAFPVCAGINLEYYFSYVDNVGYGSGTKLPHNIAAMLGVMEGAASDLRTGLPWQTVELHEPVRLLFIIETTPEAMTRIMDREPGIGRLCRNRWVRLATLDPESGQLNVFQGGAFRPYQPEAGVLPRAASSIDWYRGWRDHLEFAEIGEGA